MHNRDIYRQVDDSIVHFINDEPVPLRRSRGYVPTPVIIDKKMSVDILAAGGDMKNTFCLGKENQLICSEHIGDLEDAEVYHHYIGSIEHLKQLFEVEPEIVVCDLHPGYFSTAYAKSLKNVKLIQVQHHWAHIASVLAEHNIEGPAIGLECDGTGYGTDSAIWGCECLIADLQKFERFGHLDYYILPGGDKASKEAIRSVLGLLKKTFPDFEIKKYRWLLERIEPNIEKQKLIIQQINKQINTAQTSSLGRVFDAVAAMIGGLGSYNHHEAQLPMAVEAIVGPDIEEYYQFNIKADIRPALMDLRPMFKEIIEDIKSDMAPGIISAKFHNTLAMALNETAKTARERTKLNLVALSGGVFCNRYLANKLIYLLNKDGFNVLYNKEVPANDGGLSLGQAAIVSRRSSLVAGH